MSGAVWFVWISDRQAVASERMAERGGDVALTSIAVLPNAVIDDDQLLTGDGALPASDGWKLAPVAGSLAVLSTTHAMSDILRLLMPWVSIDDALEVLCVNRLWYQQFRHAPVWYTFYTNSTGMSTPRPGLPAVRRFRAQWLDAQIRAVFAAVRRASDGRREAARWLDAWQRDAALEREAALDDVLAPTVYADDSQCDGPDWDLLRADTVAAAQTGVRSLYATYVSAQQRRRLYDRSGVTPVPSAPEIVEDLRVASWAEFWPRATALSTADALRLRFAALRRAIHHAMTVTIPAQRTQLLLEKSLVPANTAAYARSLHANPWPHRLARLWAGPTADGQPLSVALVESCTAYDDAIASRRAWFSYVLFAALVCSAVLIPLQLDGALFARPSVVPPVGQWSMACASLWCAALGGLALWLAAVCGAPRGYHMSMLRHYLETDCEDGDLLSGLAANPVHWREHMSRAVRAYTVGSAAYHALPLFGALWFVAVLPVVASGWWTAPGLGSGSTALLPVVVACAVCSVVVAALAVHYHFFVPDFVAGALDHAILIQQPMTFGVLRPDARLARTFVRYAAGFAAGGVVAALILMRIDGVGAFADTTAAAANWGVATLPVWALALGVCVWACPLLAEHLPYCNCMCGNDRLEQALVKSTVLCCLLLPFVWAALVVGKLERSDATLAAASWVAVCTPAYFMLCCSACFLFRVVGRHYLDTLSSE